MKKKGRNFVIKKIFLLFVQGDSIPRVTGVNGSGVPPSPSAGKEAAGSSGGFLGRSWIS